MNSSRWCDANPTTALHYNTAMRSSGDGVRTARALLHHSQLQIPNPTPSRSSQLHAAACAVLCGGRQRAQHLVTPSPHPCIRRTSPHFAMLHPPAAPSGLWEQGRIRLHFANTRTPTHTAAPPPSPWATAARHNFVLGLCDALCATHTTPAPIVLQFSPEPPAAHTHTIPTCSCTATPAACAHPASTDAFRALHAIVHAPAC